MSGKPDLSNLNDPQQLMLARRWLAHEAKNSLISYAQLCDPTYRPSAFHHLMAEELEKVYLRKGGTKRLILTVPPQHGKSRLAVDEGVGWALGHNPKEHFVVASYAASRPQRSARFVRQRLEEQVYRDIFPDVEPDPQSRARHFWELKNGGSMRAVGVTSGLTGEQGTHLIIDDIHKDRREAESDTMREAAWDWYQSTAMTRLTPDAGVVIIMTRWHTDDLIGRLTDEKWVRRLESMGAENQVYKVINMPALCDNAETDPLGRKEGEALWPEYKGAKWLKGERATRSSYEWLSLYQGRPRRKEGSLVDMDKLRYCNLDEVPSHLNKPRGWDFAYTKRTRSDYTAGARGCFDKERGLFFITHIWRGQESWLKVKSRVKHYAENEKNRIMVPGGGTEHAAYLEIKEMLKGKNIVKPCKVGDDKVAHAMPWLSMVDAGRVVLVRGEWNSDFEDELTEFPDVKNDDQIDAVSTLWDICQTGSFVYA